MEHAGGEKSQGVFPNPRTKENLPCKDTTNDDIVQPRDVAKGADAGAFSDNGTKFDKGVGMDHLTEEREARGSCFTIAQMPRKVDSSRA